MNGVAAAFSISARRRPRSVASAWLILVGLALCFRLSAPAAEVIPPPPPNHFNDFARMVRPETAAKLNRDLAAFERETSNQILVAIYPRLQSASSVDDYAVRVAQSWKVGNKTRDNGAVLFVFQESRDLWITTGYGLEGALPDALAKRIIENEIIPRFRAGDFEAGLTAGVNAMMAAARGEYRGTGRTVADASGSNAPGGSVMFLVVLAFIILASLRGASRRQTIYGRRGPRTVWMNPGGWGGRGGGGWGGGGGGGTFSGGGGSFGGGGAGGKW